MAAELPSPLPKTGVDKSARFVRSGLQQLGYTDVQSLYCGGSICTASAVWEGRRFNLRIETQTGNITSPELQAENLFIRTTHNADPEYVRKQLETLPFEQVKNVRRSGAFFSAEAMYQGIPVKLQVDGASGRVVREGEDESLNITVSGRTTEAVVRRGLQEIGFTDIDDVKQDGNFWNAKALRYGEPVNVQVDGGTGVVTKR